MESSRECSREVNSPYEAPTALRGLIVDSPTVDGEMEQPLTLQWLENRETQVSSYEEFDRELDRLNAEASASGPMIVTAIHPDGAVLSIGLGREASYLNFAASPDPPYYSSLGEEAADGVVDFMYGGQPTEYPRNALVSLNAACKAAREFYGNGARPTSVRWQLD